MSDALDAISVSDLTRYGLPQPVIDEAVAEISTIASDALAGAIAFARSKLTLGHPGTFTFVGQDVVRAVCHIAAVDLLTTRGLNPEGRDALLIKRADDARSWLDDVAIGKAVANVQVTADVAPPAALDWTLGGDVQRGW